MSGAPSLVATVAPNMPEVLNLAVHTTSGEQPYFAVFSCRPLCQVGVHLPAIEGTEVGIAEAHAILRETHQKMARKFRAVANRGHINQKVGERSLVWVKSEGSLPGTCKKLNLKWLGPYQVIEVIRGGSVYVLENVFDERILQRAVEKVKPCCGSEEWITGPREVIMPEENEPEHLPPRVRRSPRRYVEECCIRSS